MSDPELKGSDPAVSEKIQYPYPTSTTYATGRPWWRIGGTDISFAAVDAASHSPSLRDEFESSSSDENNIKESVFSDRDAAEFYQPVAKYEGSHRFDPSATWSEAEEKRLIRTV
jgi:hypothetical protein